MLSQVVLALLCAAAGAGAAQPRKADCCDKRSPSGEPSLYDFEFAPITGGRNISLDQYRGHVLLLVNVATY